jgi:hypothetical protein
MHFATMAEWLAPAKVQYACPANYLDQVDAVNLTAEQIGFLKEIPDAMFRETTRDFMVNQQFRRDYWVKGVRKLNPVEQAEQIRQLRVILLTHRADVSLKANGALGEATMSDAVYAPILDFLADHKARSLGQIEQAMKEKGVQFAQILQAALVLAGQGHLVAVQDEAAISKAKKQCDRVNAHLYAKARGSGDVNYLASPVTGGGVTVGRFPQLFLLALGNGKKQPAEWSQFVWQILQAQGQKLLKEGRALETAEENLAELTAQAESFAQKQLPILKALQIA